MDAPQRYVNQLKKALGYYPTWLPQERIELGWYGTFVEGVFKRDGSLSDLNIQFETSADPTGRPIKAHEGFRFGTSGATSASGTMLDASASVTLAANHEYAWAFGAIDAKKREIIDLPQLQAAVLEQRRLGLWNDAWLIVCEVFEVETLNVLVARSRDAKGEIHARANLASPEAILLEQNASYRFDASEMFQVENAKTTTPLFGVRKVRGIFRKHVAAVRGPDGPRLDHALEHTVDEPMFTDST